MPNRKTHVTYTIVAGILVPATMLYYRFPTSEIISCVLGFVVGIYIQPDLDINSRFPRKQPQKWLWWIIWWPYSRFFNHRSIFTHFPILGTAIRIMYIIPVFAIIMILLGIDISVREVIIAWILYGLCISDMIHVLLDMVQSIIKQLL